MDRVNVYADQPGGQRKMVGHFDRDRSTVFGDKVDRDSTVVLVLTATRRWVLQEGDVHRYVLEQDAHRWLVGHGYSPGEAREIVSGDTFEEVNAGRPAIGPKISISLPSETLEAVNKAARVEQKPRSAYLRDLIIDAHSQ